MDNAIGSFKFKVEPQLVCCVFIYVSVDRLCLLQSLTTRQDTPEVGDLPFLQSSIAIDHAHIRDTTHTQHNDHKYVHKHTHKEVCLWAKPSQNLYIYYDKILIS